ncbi:MAG: hypothetical protein ABSA86_07320 [Oryzomonas sp.]
MTEGMQKQLYGIALFEEEILLSDFTSGCEKRFIVSPEQLMGFVRSKITFRPFPGLVWMQTDGMSDTYLLTLSGGVRTILYRKAKKLDSHKLTLPPLAVKARVDQSRRKIDAIEIWGMAGKGLSPDTVLYELPLPNLNGAHMCLGSTELAVTHDVREAIEKTIFDTPFNHHNHIVGREKIPFFEYIKKYRGKCPLASLNKIGSGKDILGGLK